MPDTIPSTSASTLTTTAATASPSTQLTAIQVAIADLSQSLQDLTHAIQTNATPIAAPVTTSGGTSLTLATALGNITVTLPQLGETEQANLTQQLMNLVQTQRPLTLALQPVPPPTQATLILPTAIPTTGSAQAAPAQIAAPQNIIQTQQLPSLLPPVVKGDVLPAIVLPPATAIASAALTPATQSYAPPLVQLLQNTVGGQATSVPQNQNVILSQQPPASPSTAVPETVSDEPAINVPTLEPTVQSSQSAPALLNAPAPLGSTPLTPPSTALMPPATSSPVSLTTLLQPGNEISLQVETVLPPNTPLTSLPPLGPNQIVATVTGNTPDGKLILQTGDATIFVKAQVAAPPGSTLIVTVDAPKLAPLTLLPLPEMPSFQSLAQAIAVLAQSNPQALQQMMSMHIPQPTEALPGTLLLLFGAFKQADVRGWLGNTAMNSLLNAGREDILSSLTNDLSNAGQSVQDPVVGQWHSYPIPLYVQQQFQALTLYVHDNKNQRQGREQGERPNDNKVRFLIDMRLSRLGALQLDGFVQPKKLDMILRSESLLPEGMHNDLRNSYINAMSAVGYTGSLNFQVGRHHWLNMRQQAPRGIVT